MTRMTQDVSTLAIYLFAHQDDETAVFQKILDDLETGCRVSCIYITSGVKKNENSVERNLESVRVLLSLGVSHEDIYFIGDHVGIADGDLVNQLNSASSWLKSFLAKGSNISQIYLPAWEGGHPDHDALHALAVCLGQKLGLISCMRQYSLYNGYRCKGPLFRTLLPLPANGQTQTSKVSWRNRFRFLRCCLQYPSQINTWIGLFPMMLIHYIVWGTQNLQKVSLARLNERPHEGMLYYERRKFSTYEYVALKVSELISDESSGSSK